MYGVFAYCPDCGRHNSLQIVSSNLNVAAKQLGLAESQDQVLAGQLVSDALGKAVAAFDAFARELFRVHSACASKPSQAESLSGQNLARLRDRVSELFGFDLREPFAEAEWNNLERAFQKRHLIAHKMGVVDEAYIAATGDHGAVKGRKIPLSAAEVQSILPLVRRLGEACPRPSLRRGTHVLVKVVSRRSVPMARSPALPASSSLLPSSSSAIFRRP